LLAAFVALSAAASPIGSGWPEQAVVGADRTVLESLGAQPLPVGLEVRGPTRRRRCSREKGLSAAHPCSAPRERRSVDRRCTSVGGRLPLASPCAANGAACAQ
jgi:hypothetical protein